MKHYKNTQQFYNGIDWANCKAQVTQDRLKDGALYCEHCEKIILKGFNPNNRNNSKAIVYHHIEHLNNFNVNDASIAINPNNIAIVHWQCHNEIHNRFNGSGNNRPDKKVYLITGASCSGKTTFVRERIAEGDIVLDIDDIWQQLSGQGRYVKPKSLTTFVMQIREEIKKRIASGVGNWANAYIIESTFKSAIDLQREVERYKAHNVELIEMEATKEECIARLNANPNGRNVADYTRYIEDYFNTIQFINGDNNIFKN